MKMFILLTAIFALLTGCGASSTPSRVVKPKKQEKIIVETKIEHDKIAGLFVYPGGTRKAVIMSFDDGPSQDKRLIEMFNKYGIKGSFNLNSAKLTGRKKAELQKLYKGHEVAIHTVTHPHLEYLTEDKIRTEVEDDKKALETLFGYPVRGMAYPFGTYNQTVLNVLPNLGVAYSRTVTIDSTFRLPKNFLVWNPTCHTSAADYSIKQFLGTNKNELMQLFIWGHAWEFDNGANQAAKDANWAKMEAICKTLFKETNIWFATGIEFCDYINAAQAAYTAGAGRPSSGAATEGDSDTAGGGKALSNTSGISLWVNTSEGIVELLPGDAINL